MPGPHAVSDCLLLGQGAFCGQAGLSLLELREDSKVE